MPLTIIGPEKEGAKWTVSCGIDMPRADIRLTNYYILLTLLLGVGESPSPWRLEYQAKPFESVNSIE